VILPSTIGNIPIIVSPVASSTIRTCRFRLPGAPAPCTTRLDCRKPHRNPLFRHLPLCFSLRPGHAWTRGVLRKDATMMKTGFPENPACSCPAFRHEKQSPQADRVRSLSLGRRTRPSIPCHPHAGVAGLRQSVSRHKQSQTPFLVTHAPLCLSAPCTCPEGNRYRPRSSVATHPTSIRS
jgi:hypothetical protein